MALSSDMSSIDTREGEVSNCVSNLMQAFANAFDIFKRLRERRRKRKSKKPQGQIDPTSGTEAQLSNSLRRAPLDIHSSYHSLYSTVGSQFAQGDAIAHRSLAETLIKLNTGLVCIITTFLNHDTNATHVHLDYKSLTSLSNASREEAVNSLYQLAQRLSRSQVQVYRITACPKCGSSKHQKCSGSTSSQSSKHRSQLDKTKYTGASIRSNSPTVVRVPIKSSSQTQLVYVRPRNTRKHSTSSSSSSSRTQSTARTSPSTSPIGSPLPQYAQIDPFPPVPPKPATLKAAPTKQSRRSLNDDPQPVPWPSTRLDAPTNSLPVPPPKTPSPQRSSSPKEKRSPLPATEVFRRRADKLTPSTFTFASGSTKLGEIPERNWAIPFDYAEAERLNAEALVVSYPLPDGGDKRKAKKGLFGFLRRGSAGAAAP